MRYKKQQFYFAILLPLLATLVVTALITNWQTVQAWQIESATERAPATAPSLWVHATGLDFGPVPVGELGWWSFEFQNIGNAPLSITTEPIFDLPFVLGATPACATNLAPGGSCNYLVQFLPTATGVFSQTFEFDTNAGPFSIQLTGEGILQSYYVDPLSLDFGSVLIGNTRVLSATIYNTGAYHLDLSIASPPTPDFGSSSGDCAGGNPPGDSCTVYLSFAPTQSGILTDTYTINTPTGPVEIFLKGSGRSVPFLFGPHQRFTPQSLDFGPVRLGESKTLTVTFSNESLNTAISTWAGGGVAAPFSATQNCAGGVPAGQSCQFLYTFSPIAEGQFTTQSNGSNSVGPFSIALRAEGVQPRASISERVLNFGPFETISDHDVSLRNVGKSHLYIDNVQASSPLFIPDWGCSSGLPPFLASTGCGITFDFSSPTPAFVTEVATIYPDGQSSNEITLIAGARPADLDITFLPAQISAGGTATLQYQITNPNRAMTFYFGSLIDLLPLGMDYKNPLTLSASSECGFPTLLPVAGNPPTLIINDATILGGDTCVILLDVVVASDGFYLNTLDYVTTGTDPNDPTWLDTSNPAATFLSVDWEQIFLPLIIRSP